MILPESGLWTNWDCRSRYSSSARMSCMRRVNTGVSIMTMVDYTSMAYRRQDKCWGLKKNIGGADTWRAFIIIWLTALDQRRNICLSGRMFFGYQRPNVASGHCLTED